MDELKGFIPVIIGLFVVFVVIAAFGSAMSWLISNPVALILLIGAIGVGVYLWIKRHRARTMV